MHELFRYIGIESVMEGVAIGGIWAASVGIWSSRHSAQNRRSLNRVRGRNRNTVHGPEIMFDESFALSLRNFRAARSYTLFTYSFVHLRIWELLLSLSSTLVIAPRVVRIYGIVGLYVTSIGSACTGAMIQIYINGRLESDSPHILRFCTGSGAAHLGLITVLTCPSYMAGGTGLLALSVSVPVGFLFWNSVYSYADLGSTSSFAGSLGLYSVRFYGNWCYNQCLESRTMGEA